jgi:hypothetical protein
MKVSLTVRIVTTFLGSALGGFGSMVVLRIFNDWAFRTEFAYWLRITAVHSLEVFLLFTFWFGLIHTNVRGPYSVANFVGVIAIGGLLAVFIPPYGFLLIITGHAFITSGLAALVCTGVFWWD